MSASYRSRLPLLRPSTKALCSASILGILTYMLSACSLPFYFQAVGGQLELLRKRVPIASILADPARDPAFKQKLMAVAEIRQFAVEELGLPDNKSYKSYADLQRPYVVWNVVAAEEFSVEPKRWCFLFVGCVSYRGFFKHEAAERFAARLAEQGLDVAISGASAYSTLGYFADPVLNTMLAGGEEYVASILFHELAHQRLYVKSDTEFSEAFATAIEEFGTERWLLGHHEEEVLRRYRQRLRYRADFTELLIAQQARLRDIFSRDDPDDVKREAKARAYERMREDYLVMKERWGGVSDYDAWFSRPVNNAHLAAVATYRRWVPGLRWQLENLGLEAFYAQAAELAELPAGERRVFLQTWLDEALNAQQPDVDDPTGPGGLLQTSTSARSSPSS